MRTRAAVFSLGVLAISATALAQHHGAAHPAAGHPAHGSSAAPATSGAPEESSWAAAGGAPVTASAAPHAAASAAPVATPAASSAPTTTATTATASAAPSSGAPAGTHPTTFDIPMVQRGAGAMVHYPIPEQLARNEIPVFVQVRSSAPIDHVSMFYRGQGAARYREVRMASAGGANLGLPNGYGGTIPCEDAFPPAVEYYVQAIDTSGGAVGTAGSASQPISLPVVRERHFNIIPTIPGANAPRNCGSLDVAIPAGTGTGTNTGTSGTGGTGTSNTNTAPTRGTADLGEPCHSNDDCTHGLRCGSTHTCVFVRSN